MLEFINYFFVPSISLVIFCKRNNVTMKEIQLDILAKYCIYVVIDAIATFCIFKLLLALIGIEAYSTSNVYTIIAVIVAILVPYVQEIINKYFEVRIEINKNNEE